ncbi:hypothetical protein L3X38_002299 [Prunus dulcis]|uniref:Uncharacterized protein n=1 Tax=Prunus dulcis TaxID=3755 RepID=A0AAD4WXA7_PRUDU|nr:hypothetical protein L3X38_002299 [Prunus dulcis]
MWLTTSAGKHLEVYFASIVKPVGKNLCSDGFSANLNIKRERILRSRHHVRHFGLGNYLGVAGGWVRDKLVLWHSKEDAKRRGFHH